VFLGDNGFLCGAKGLSGKVYPWEPSVRVPFILSGGLARKRGVVSQDPVASIDLPATFLDIAGIRTAKRCLKPYLATGKGSIDEGFSVWADGRADALTVNQAVEPYRLVRTRTHNISSGSRGGRLCSICAPTRWKNRRSLTRGCADSFVSGSPHA
jgi:arylsulfatase A-like enzyme